MAQKSKSAPRQDNVFEREIYKTNTGTYLIFTPYKPFEGRQVWYSLIDQDFKAKAVAKDGKITVRVTDYHNRYPGGQLEGAKVMVGLEEKNEEIVKHIEKKYTF